MELSEILSGTLAWVNVVRRECGLPTLAALPQGSCASASDCPIARAIEAIYVDGYGAWIEDGPDIATYVMPEVATEFVRAFDDGDFPELIAA